MHLLHRAFDYEYSPSYHRQIMLFDCRVDAGDSAPHCKGQFEIISQRDGGGLDWSFKLSGTEYVFRLDRQHLEELKELIESTLEYIGDG